MACMHACIYGCWGGAAHDGRTIHTHMLYPPEQPTKIPAGASVGRKSNACSCIGGMHFN